MSGNRLPHRPIDDLMVVMTGLSRNDAQEEVLE
jgi:hypothetical protein